MRSALPALLGAFLLSCATATGPEPAPPPTNERSAPAASSARPPAAVPPAPSSQRVVPDVPAGAAAAHDAELRAKAAPIVDAFLNTAAVLSREGNGGVFGSE